jgi:hypothetical protein
MAPTQPAAKLEREKKLKSVLSESRALGEITMLMPYSFRLKPLQAI